MSAAVLKEALDKAQAPVPPPTKSQRNDEQAALLHLNKMKAAASAEDGAMAAVAAETKLVNPHTGEAETEDERAERIRLEQFNAMARLCSSVNFPNPLGRSSRFSGHPPNSPSWQSRHPFHTSPFFAAFS